MSLSTTPCKRFSASRRMARSLLAGALLALLTACDGLVQIGTGTVYTVLATQNREFAEEDMGILVTRLRALKHNFALRIEASQQDGIRRITINRGSLPNDAAQCVARYAGRFRIYSDDPQAPWLDHSDLESVGISRTDGLYYLDFSIDDEAVERFARLTREHVGEPLTMSIDGDEVNKATVQTELGKQFRVAMLSKAEAQCFSIVLSHGALSQPYKLVRE